MREAEALANAGMEVDVICLRHKPSDPLRERINGVNLFRVPMGRRRSGKMAYVFRYAAFFISAFCRLAFWSFKKRYKLVHVHNMPDFLVFTALLPRLRGAKIILDLHDPMPELFGSIYNLSADHFISRCLRWLEKRSLGFAEVALTPNLAFQHLFSSRSCSPEKIQIIMNTPNTAIFKEREEQPGLERNPNGAFVLMYHGLLVERHGLDLAVRALALLRDRIPRIKFEVYGEQNGYIDRVLSMTRELGIEGNVHYFGFKPLTEIADAIQFIHLGVVPNRLNAFTSINLPTRIFEYLAMNKPVIVPRTKGISDYFCDDNMLFFEPENIADLAEKIRWAYEHPQALSKLVQEGRKVYDQHSWAKEEKKLLEIVTQPHRRGY
jgi:glycosyltransferase involved in cell wall biosynthesis